MLHPLSEYSRYLLALRPVEIFNCAMAFAAGTVTGLAIFRSMDARTIRAMRWAFATITVGFFGQGATILFPNTWSLGYDAMLLGGSLALFLGSRRHTQLVPEPWSMRASLAVTVASWGMFFFNIK